MKECYTIAYGSCLGDLTEAVEAMIQHDARWKPAGGVFVDTNGIWLQAMYRDPKQNPPLVPLQAVAIHEMDPR